MPQSLAQVDLHLIFSTKNRLPFLEDPALRADVHQYLGGICRTLEAPALIVGGVADHVHLLCRFSRVLTMADFLQALKRDSSKWIRTKDPTCEGFHWQDGYGVFSISPAHVEALKLYIANQEEHHCTESFQDEFRRILRKYGVELRSGGALRDPRLCSATPSG